MKLTRMLGAAICGAIVATMVIGATSASAGAIVCWLSGVGAQGDCPTAAYEPWTGQLKGLGLGVDTFVSSLVTIKCNGEMSGEISTQGSKTTNAKGSIKSVKWSNCTNNLGCSNTTAKAGGLPWGVEVLPGSLHISKVLGSFSMDCSILGPVTCIYTESSVLPTLENHTSLMPNAMIGANKLPLIKESGSSASCSETGNWSALYDLDPEGLSVFGI